MHTNQTHNTLKIENPELLTLPDDVKPFLKTYNWGEVIWNSFGLPAFNSGFCLTGDQLYFESDANERVMLRKSDFTGQALVSAVITPDESDKVYVLTIELTFCKGIMCSSAMVEYSIKPRVEYDAGFQAFLAKNQKITKFTQTFWFLYLYRPYFYFLKWTTISVVFIVELLLKIFVWCIQKITPIKIQ